MAGLALTIGVACTVDSAKSHYLLAERLWNDGKYAAAVTEFDKVTKSNPKGKLGLQALMRGATTQTLFLGEHLEAIEKFNTFAKVSTSPSAVWSAEKQIGEILFSKLRRFDEAIHHYRTMLQRDPKAEEAPQFLFRIGKSHFFLWEFDEAIEVYQELIKKHPEATWAARAMFEIGVSRYTSGEQQPGGEGPQMSVYHQAIEAYEAFLAKHPDHELVPQARFGIGECLEELDRLDDAYKAFEALKETYPSPKVVLIKLTRIRERIAQRNR